MKRPHDLMQPFKQKRRKSAGVTRATRGSTADEGFYEVRDILDEKSAKGRLLYKVDWADNPTTGERYQPTWEPAENVTEAAVADWQREKRRREDVARHDLHPAVECDGRPGLAPNRRVKRGREPSVVDEERRPPKRHRASADSGYTSTEGDLQSSAQSSWAHVLSVPHNNGQLVLEIVHPPNFDPSEYRVVNSSQSAPSSQVVDAAASSRSSGQHTGGQVSQRTIQDSQDPFDSLRTQSTGQSAAHLSEPTSQAQISRSDLDIPSRQPETSHHDLSHPSGLLEAHEAASQNGPHSSLRPHPQLGQDLASDDSPWGEGFLTQPDYEPPNFGFEAESPQPTEGPSSDQSSSQPRANDPASQSFPARGTNSAPSASDAHSPLQAAQAVSLHINNLGLLRSFFEGTGQDLGDIVPETLPRPPKTKSPLQIPNQTASRRLGEEISPSEEVSPSFTPEKEKNAPQPSTPPESKHGWFRRSTPSAENGQDHVIGTSPAVPPTEYRQEPALLSPSAVLPPPSGTFAERLEASAAPVDSSALETPLGEQPLPAVSLNQQGGGLGQDSSMDFNMPTETPAMGGPVQFEQQPVTVAPSDLTTSVEHPPVSLDDLAADDQVLGGGVDDQALVPLNQPDQFQSPPGIGGDEQDEDDSLVRHFTVTLPMAANTRAKYLDTITENKATLIKFGDVFANSCSSVPDPALVTKIDVIFDRLLNLCDLPAYEDDLPELSKVDMMKHATNSNSKFSFVYEFINGLWDINARILIISQPGRAFEYLEAVVSTTDCPYTILGQEGSTEQGTEVTSVVLAVAGQDLSAVQGGVDVVIAYDHTARSVELPATLGFESMEPIVLSLVATYSLDHIDQQLHQAEQDLDSLERRNVLNLATATAMDYLRNPDRQSTEPHQAAKTFAAFLRNPESGLDWEPHPLPADIFEMWLSSQERTQESQVDLLAEAAGRKRRLDGIDDGIPKRPRLLDSQLPSRNSTPARMTDLLRQTLTNHPVSGPTAQVVEVPVEQLEKMSAKIAELESRLASQAVIEAKTREHCTSLELQLRSHERTVQSLEPKYMDALRDRHTFEKECKKAVEAAKAQQDEAEALREKNKLLESKFAEARDTLANSTVPEIARVAQAEKDRDEALATVQKLEKKVQGVQNEAEYSRKAYQDTFNAHTGLNQEHQELKSKVTDLERRAGDNLRKIHEIHAQNELTEVNRQIDELQATLDNRERELERAKEELKILRNGRRETRQASVPRSPRMGVMSPRPARGVGASSRGTSPAAMSSDGPGVGGGGTPVPGMTFFPPVGGAGRWGHLRD
ncbi:uncharacterized protein B0H64DRAFT_457707 [Chaetomium fimeti]|uniref:Chromo domain-containing protein n=1 Tax=Chaetomium fimeti TaxID=1854472 RepID=A0AAE0LTS9_9PEZI|nr:hypothetical protein B0H64DRAFT_457707 [Chaetomium fimeti]